jgi:hypothetical protein
MGWLVWFFGFIVVFFEINALEKINFRQIEQYEGKEIEIAGFVVEKEGERYLVANPSKRPCCQDIHSPPLLLKVPSQDLPSYQRQMIRGVIKKVENRWVLELC